MIGTGNASGHRKVGPAGRRYDHFFFSGMALLNLATVFLGFAHSYYLAGVFRAPLPNWIIHIHGAIFSCWLLFLINPTSLVAAGRTDIHLRLGVAGFLLECLMIVVGVLAASDVGAVRRVTAVAGQICSLKQGVNLCAELSGSSRVASRSR